MSKKRRKKSKSAVRPLGPTKHVLSQFYMDLGGPTALGLYLCLKYNDWVSVVSHDLDPSLYTNVEDFRAAYCAMKVASKLTGVPGYSDSDRETSALSKYLDAEEDLAKSDTALRFVHSPHSKYYCAETSAILTIARGKIAQILGSISLDDVCKNFRFGPGSSSSCSGRDVSVANKMKADGLECTYSALPFLEAFLNWSSWGEHIASVNTKECIEIVLVPKNSKTFRVIGKEPDFNVMLQLGLGAVIRRRLKKFGVDLDNGWSLNASLARRGSLDGSLATIDFSAASDRISYNLVRELLPDDWFEILSAARTPLALHPSFPDALRLRKFSSMGNGCTFELESLIFYALAFAGCEFFGFETSDICIFGDDLILPSSACSKVLPVMEHLGFRVNKTKSYSSGPFRESCGSHWFLGVDVKPIYLKELLYEKTTKYKFANAVRRLAGRFGHIHIDHCRLASCYRATISTISGRLHLIPEGFGDGGLIKKFDEAVPVLGNRLRSLPDGWQGYKVKALLPRGKVVSHDSPLALLAFLFEKQRRGPLNLFEIDEAVDRAGATSGILFDLRLSTVIREGHVVVFEWNDPVA